MLLSIDCRFSVRRTFYAERITFNFPRKPTTVSILLFSLSIYFFQYVKERFLSLELKVQRLKLLKAFCFLLSAFRLKRGE